MTDTLELPFADTRLDPVAVAPVAAPAEARLWMPRRVVFTPAALAEPHGQAIHERCRALGLPVEELPANRLTGLRGGDERAGQFRLQPIPPSADWQFHLAEGCPAHCQYCYLAGSLSGPPVVRAYANYRRSWRT